MKTKNLLSRFSAAALVAAAALLPAALTSCSSEAEPNVPTPDPIPEGMARINFGISTPSIESVTRAADGTVPATSDQATLDNLYLYIFKVENSSETFVARLNCGSDTETIKPDHAATSDYSQIYSHAFTPGDYKFYVVANIDGYLAKTDNKTILDRDIDATHTFSLSDLTGATLDFTGTGNQASLLRAKDGKGLPMAADCTDVAVIKKDGTTLSTSTTPTLAQAYNKTTGVVTIGSGAYEISMDLTFLCSAVRYTFLYDGSEGNYESAWNYDHFSVESINLTNAENTYSIFATTGAATAAAGTAVDLKREGKKFTFAEGQMGTVASNPASGLTAISGDDWTAQQEQRAYQDIVYLPMNTTTNDNLRTTLTLGYKTSSASDATTKTTAIKLPGVKDATDNVLNRGAFYEVVGTLTTTGMKMYVTVKPWIKEDRKVLPL